MLLEPLLTEKTLSLAKEGKYTFRVPRNYSKFRIKKLIEDTFAVHVVKVWTVRESGEIKKTLTGRKKVITPKKKAIVKLQEKEKISIFEGKK